MTGLRSPERDEKDRLYVQAAGRNPLDIADEVIEEALAHNKVPRLFRMGETIVRAQDDGTLKPYGADLLLLHVSGQVTFYVMVKGEKKPINPPAAAMKIAYQAALGKLPVLDGVAHTPYLDSAGGVISASGYNEGSRRYLHSPDLRMATVPENPTAGQVGKAVAVLDEWLHDFPFSSKSDKANVIALLLTLTGRAFFGIAPMFVVDASTAGSGKGLLVNTLSLIATGESPDLLGLPADGEEQRKQITSALMQGRDLIAWDETHIIEGRTLARILTAENYSDRVLGASKIVTVKNRFTQVAIGNNVQVWGDIKRRVVPTRLVPDQEHPEYRTDFLHPQLDQWVIRNRGKLLAAVLTIWRSWITSGRPAGAVAMGSFERWSQAVGGALGNAGITGFLDGTKEWVDDGDPGAEVWREHLAALRELYPKKKEFTASDVAGHIRDGFLTLPGYVPDPRRPVALETSVGIAYRGIRERWFGNFRLEHSAERSSATGGRKYIVRRRTATAETGHDIPSVPSGPSVGAGHGKPLTCEAEGTEGTSRSSGERSGARPQALPGTEGTEGTEGGPRAVSAAHPKRGKCVKCGQGNGRWIGTVRAYACRGCLPNGNDQRAVYALQRGPGRNDPT